MTVKVISTSLGATQPCLNLQASLQHTVVVVVVVVVVCYIKHAVAVTISSFIVMASIVSEE